MGWIIALGIFMPLDWLAAGKRWVKFRVFSKPVSMLILIFIFISLGGGQSTGILFLGGLIFSLLGDIFLLMRSRFFIAGLISFLIAHVFYIVGLSLGALNWSVWMLVPIAIISLLIILAYPRIIGGIRRRLEHRHLWLPVLLYMVTITLMLLLAMLTWFREPWIYPSALLVSAGALLFTISDTMLATGRFLRPIPYGNFLVMFTYHLGQLGIAFGALSMMGLI
jgi:uncharacterized membrane protein YhhN